MPHQDNRVDGGAAFEERWRRRFERYAVANNDDARIAGWSAGGLAARYRRFSELWCSAQEAPTKQGRWLDVGCGAGTYTRFLAVQQLRVTGVDYSVPTAQKARERSGGDIDWAAADVTQLPFCDGTFDGVLCLGVMQALDSPHRALRELRRVLRPGGTLWVDALNANCLPSAVAEQVRRARGRPRHLRYDAPTDFCRVLAQSDFRVIDVFWVPIMPSIVRVLQPLAESAMAQRVLRSIPALGRRTSHSLLARAVASMETTQ